MRNLQKVIKKAFSNQEVRLDNSEYIECTFESCRLIYSAKGRFRFTGSIVSSDCEFQVRGQAADTIAALHDLYNLGDWGRRRVLATLHHVARKARAQTNDLHEELDDGPLGYLVPEDNDPG